MGNIKNIPRPHRSLAACMLPLVWSLLLARAPVARSSAEQNHTPALFLPGWHFFQSGTTLEAIGELTQASRAVATALRLEPQNKEFRRIRERIWRKQAHAERMREVHQLSITLKMGRMEGAASVGWNFGESAHLVSKSVTEQLDVGPEWEQPLYRLIVQHQHHMNLTRPPVALGPPWDIPFNYRAGFTMYSHAVVERHFIDSTLRKWALASASDTETEVKWSRSEIEALVRDARAGALKYYGLVDSHLLTAMSVMPRRPSMAGNGLLQDKRVAVISIGYADERCSGAWYEAVSLAFGARSCVSFRPCAPGKKKPTVSFQHPLLRSQCFPERGAEHKGERFDVVIAMKTQHFGLGRFGETVDAEGDIGMMHAVKSMLVADGVLLLALPVIFHDFLVWNAHRLYGPLRLPRLLSDWVPDSVYGFAQTSLFKSTQDAPKTILEQTQHLMQQPLQMLVFYLTKHRPPLSCSMSRSKLYTQSEMHTKHIVDAGEMQSAQLERHERFPPPLPEAVVHTFKQYLHCLHARGITLEEEGGGAEGDLSMLNITQIAFTCLQVVMRIV